MVCAHLLTCDLHDYYEAKSLNNSQGRSKKATDYSKPKCICFQSS